MPRLSKGHKQDNFESYNSLKLIVRRKKTKPKNHDLFDKSKLYVSNVSDVLLQFIFKLS